MLHRCAIVPDRFCGVGAWFARSNSAVFLRDRDRGCEDVVDFPGIGGDGYFNQKGFTRTGTAAQSLGVHLRQGEQLVPELRGAAGKRKVHQLSRREHGHALGSAGFHRGSEIL